MSSRSGSDRAPVLLPLALLTPVVAFLVSFPALGPAAILAALIGLVSALGIAAPSLKLARARGLHGFWRTTSFGAAVGTVPFLLWGAVVSVIDGRLEPSLGFIALEGLAALVGAATGAVYWILHDGTARSRLGLLLRVVASVGAAASVPLVIAAWPNDAWPKYRERRETMHLAWEFGSALDQTNTREVRAWRPERPSCVSSIYLPALVHHLETVRPADIEIEIIRVKRINRADTVRVVRIADSAIAGPIVFIQGCHEW